MKINKFLPKILTVVRKPQTVKVNPENLQIDITTSCNLKCKMCPRYTLEASEQNKSISLEAFKKIIDDVMPGSVNLAATGEPFLHPGFFEMVKYAKSKSNAVTLTSSNFTLLTPETIGGIISSGLDILKISVDSHDPGTYRQIRGQDYLPAIIKNISLLNNAKKTNRAKKPSVRIDCVVMKENFRQLKDMVKFGAENSADAVMFRLLDTTRIEDRVKKELLSGINVEELIRELKSADLFAKKTGMVTNLGDILRDREYIMLNYSPDETLLSKSPARGVCLLPWLQMFVSVSGDASPCCGLYPSGKLEEGETGNLFTLGAGQVWNSEKMKNLRKIFRSKKNYEIFRACGKCNPMDMKKLFHELKMFPGIIKIK